MGNYVVNNQINKMRKQFFKDEIYVVNEYIGKQLILLVIRVM